MKKNFNVFLMLKENTPTQVRANHGVWMKTNTVSAN